ncbi:MAG TPA: two-component regulator propeller domain-containing protein, partial [Pyrinomonadaceae bacterium]|nr:two-component regulator propeller domain-containing protein [Pyrinomonadaceae bacterium]
RITAMTMGKDNEILLSTFVNGVLKYDGENFSEILAKTDIHRSIVISIAETSAGEIWMGTRDAGLVRLTGQEFSLINDGLPDQKINCLLPDGNNGLLIGTDKGIVRWDGNRLTNEGTPSMLNNVQILSMLRDRDSNIWIGTDTLGLLRFNSGGITVMGKNDQITKGAISALFEDREGNLWAGNDEGIERYRDSTFVTYSTAEGLPSEKNGPVFVDSENRTWFAPLKGGLAWLKGNQIENLSADGLAEDIIYSITGGNKNDVWIGRQRGGLTNIQANGTAKTYTQKDGLAQNSIYSVYQSRDGTVWAGTLSGGVSRFKDGKFTNYTTANGLASNTVMAIVESADGKMYFATPNGLSLFSNGNWQTLTVQNGLPSENIISLFEDTTCNLWLGTAKGVAFIDPNGQIHFSTDTPPSLHESILGLAQDKNGFLWLSTANHVLRVNHEKLLNGVISAEDVREYGLPDGLKSVEGVKRNQSVTADKDGRIWFSLGQGLSMVDANRLKNNSVPALVQIQTISADGAPIELQENVQIPSAKQRITFNYAGLSLTIPERVKFRYRLEGFDKDWSPPTDAREAVYTNLSPGVYSFHVIASNSDGIWNSNEAIFSFEMVPMFWQTWWFWSLCVIALAFCLLTLYRLRLRRVTNRLNLRFEERLAERTRIAQELHDSLLQGFVSVSMQLNVAVDNVPTNSKAKPQLTRILELMGQVTDEGRNTLRGLRSSNGNNSYNLEQAFAEIRQDFTAEAQADFCVIVEGLPRQLSAITRDEVYLIGREALLNAYRHSKAKKI